MQLGSFDENGTPINPNSESNSDDGQENENLPTWILVVFGIIIPILLCLGGLYLLYKRYQ